jgi:hypothetical protein
MRTGWLAVVIVGLVVGSAAAQDPGARAWQQRLDVEVPLQVPVVALDAVNPFAFPVDEPPRLSSVTPPTKVPVNGTSVVAAYVDPKGTCHGAVPLEQSFSGITTELVRELIGTRFVPGRVGRRPEPSWVVIELPLRGKVKKANVVEQVLELPDPAVPPRVPEAPLMAPPGRLVSLPATPRRLLSQTASPKRLKLKVPGREVVVPVRALVYVAETGRCEQYVPLEMDSGLLQWMDHFLASWRVQPASRDGAPVGAWVVYSARVRMDLSSLESTDARVLTEREYDPLEHYDRAKSAAD